MNERKIERISWTIGGLMISVAILIDLVQFIVNLIPFAGGLLASGISIFGSLTFFLWFKFRKVDYDNKKLITSFTAILIEFIPVLNALPALTLSVVALILLTRAEDFVNKASLKNKTATQYTRERLQKLRERGSSNYISEPATNV